MGRKRYKDQILCRILEACAGGGGASKTQIVYNSGLNFHTVVPYLELVIRNDLVMRIDGEVPMYKMTPKGSEALGHLRELEVLISEMRDLAEEEGVCCRHLLEERRSSGSS